ncbi:chromosome transmission fidelity protein 18 homolog [Stylonychia lemnae]|uniref:Chromosome transmission fidelity protein 18 homolog n=1 Tax=Stylonychia lemnae TaxID=5949 RepID=A0A078AHW5_STYLE|nr:chromosome transmission fidelity protein 18 homolog [Stylonychia lemnae]|eukprot:CDW81860.1 chromosome transmission fidelity protein 18 homolog [Stylonychia lemnae]
MELLKDRFYESLIKQSYDSQIQQNKQSTTQANQTVYDQTDPEQFKLYIEQYMHHYLSKKIPQTKIKFYEVDKQTQNIENEFPYVAEKFEQEELDAFAQAVSSNHNRPLLEMDINVILNLVKQKRTEKEKQLHANLQSEEMRQIEDDFEMDEDGNIIIRKEQNMQEDIDVEEQVQQISNDSRLWVDKYTSKKYIDLLTDEVTNRNVLTWLKTWDEMVFPYNDRVNLKMPLSMQKKFVQSGYNQIHTGQKSSPQSHQFIQHQDIFSYKNKKVIVLYGPPGTGKSTMARVLANHCGYRVQEINASDERSGEKILEKIKNATQMNSYFGSAPSAGGNGQDDSTKPVCLIVDEVDGALGGGSGQESTKGVGLIVEYLKKCISYSEKTTKKKNNDNNEDEDDEDIDEKPNTDEDQEENKYIKKGTNKKKKDDGIRELRRPIIFICNDLYTRALIPLREIALAVKIEESNFERLLTRLRYICKQENFKIEDQIVRELCEETRYDARSCINTLQFLASQQRGGGEKITVNQAIEAQGRLYSGKDSFDRIFNVIDDILFCKDRHTYTNNTKLIKEVKEKVHSVGDPELINDYLYHNYSGCVNYFDDDLEKTAFFLDSLSRADINDRFIRRTQNYEMLAVQYLPAYTFRKFCSGNRANKTEFPREIKNIRQTIQKNKYIFDQLLDLEGTRMQKKGYRRVKKNEVVDEERFKLDKNTSLQTGVRKRDFNTDLLPYIYQMIHPQIREINTQLFTKHEKQSFSTALEIMVMFDITLTEEQDPNEQTNLTSQNPDIAKFEPNITQLVTFLGGNKLYMRNKTQVLVMQNYESIKQRMLTSNAKADDYFEYMSMKKTQAIEDTKLQGYGFLAGFAQQSQQNQKKRRLDQISGGSAAPPIQQTNALSLDEKANKNVGRFIYKFKEGHSKNFKRELNFDYFIS